MAVSLLYSREATEISSTGRKDLSHCGEDEQMLTDLDVELHPMQRRVGLDPGKKNLATMIDKDGAALKYTARQRYFENRYRNVLNNSWF